MEEFKERQKKRDWKEGSLSQENIAGRKAQ